MVFYYIYDDHKFFSAVQILNSWLISYMIISACIVVNMICLSYGIIYNKCTSYKLFTLSKKFAYLCADIKSCFPYFIVIQGYNLFLALFLYSKFVYNITLILFILSELIILWADMTHFVCVYFSTLMRKIIQAPQLLWDPILVWWFFFDSKCLGRGYLILSFFSCLYLVKNL